MEAGKLGLGETDIDNMELPAMKFEDAAMAFTNPANGKAISLEGA